MPPRRRAIDAVRRPKLETLTPLERWQGRLQERTVHISKNLAWRSEPEWWSKLGVLVEVISTRTEFFVGKPSREARYYISDELSSSAERTATLIRGTGLLKLNPPCDREYLFRILIGVPPN